MGSRADSKIILRMFYSEQYEVTEKRKYNKASADAVTGPGISDRKYMEAQRSPLPPSWGTGGGIY